MTDKNHARRFNSYAMPKVNQMWAAKVLGMSENPKYTSGPDLLFDDGKFVEVKFTLSNPKKTNRRRDYSKSWTVLDPQTEYEETQGRIGFWGLGLYELDRLVDDIDPSDFKDLKKLELFVKSRELYIIAWNWIYQFPASHVSGQTERSKWDRYLRYPKARLIPTTTRQYPVEKGFVYLTQGVPENLFANISQNP